MCDPSKSITIALSWCLAWGDKRDPQINLSTLKQMRQALLNDAEVPEETKTLVANIKTLQTIDQNYFPETIEQLQQDYPQLYQEPTQIGLVYGGATKIKQYVFESAKLPEIRGASAFLDRINLVDLPAFFGKGTRSITVSQWLKEHYPDLFDALIPELIIYSTGGNILSFCPAEFIDELANAIEKRYTHETLSANSCAVGDSFKLLEFRFGLLKEPINQTFWLNQYRQNANNPIIEASFGTLDSQNETELQKNFKNRKSFNQLTTKLASMFNRRRSGNKTQKRPNRRYPPMFETHPYLIRDGSDRRSSIAQIGKHSNQLHFSESSIRKHIIGQIAKREVSQNSLPPWFNQLKLQWQPRGITIKSWVAKFEEYLNKPENQALNRQYYGEHQAVEEAISLKELGNVANGFVAYLYADGNNMGGYIQTITTPEKYIQFSQDIFIATEESVYQALATHLHPHRLKNLNDPDNQNRNGKTIHPFEILTIGGDDVMLIVPANKALEIAQTLGEAFEQGLAKTDRYPLPTPQSPTFMHRYQGSTASPNQSCLSLSTGVLITAENTPVYYAENLTNQLLKSAKKKAKNLKDYHGGTVDFLALKSVTMISSNIEAFRQQALKKVVGNNELKFYAAPYILPELNGLIETIKALKKANFPKSQLYQIRSFLAQGKRIAILNYRYFRTRLNSGNRGDLEKEFEQAWCEAKTNSGNIAPWICNDGVYETIWPEMVDLYEFIDPEPEQTTVETAAVEARN